MTNRTDTSATIQIQPDPAGVGFRLQASLWLPQPRERIFAFFSDAHQLETLTPPWLKFSVLTASPIHIQTDTLIDYRLRLRGIPVRWRSRISLWQPPERFVDEQVRGPYRFWHHLHTFEEVDGGTLCGDEVHYNVPGGRLINSLLVRRDLMQIFTYRQQKLCSLFTAGAQAQDSALHA